MGEIAGRHERRAIDLRWSEDGWSARLTSTLDAETEAFETELLAGGVELPVFQRHAWMLGSDHEYRVMQLQDPDGTPAMQVALDIERPRRMPMFGRAFSPRLGTGISIDAEWYGVRALAQLARDCGDLVSLRLQPYRRDPVALRDFEARGRRAGFQLCDPVSVTRTLLVDLSSHPDQLIAELSKGTRGKIRHKSRQSVIIRELSGAAHIESCHAAANASLSRSNGGLVRFDFAAAFAFRDKHPERMHALGLFLPEDPDRLVAYAIACRHGEMAEYISAGSLDHAKLRAMSFNSWLMWDLVSWAHQRGAQWFDLGGITDGGPGDTRVGISSFKRHFSKLDAEVGRELTVDLQPARAFALTWWSQSRPRRPR
jgi:hypothetical protein